MDNVFSSSNWQENSRQGGFCGARGPWYEADVQTWL